MAGASANEPYDPTPEEYEAVKAEIRRMNRGIPYSRPEHYRKDPELPTRIGVRILLPSDMELDL